MMEKISFIKLPVDLRNYKNDSIHSKINECRECSEKAKDLGIDMKKLCPELNCDNLEEEIEDDYDIVSTFDYIRPEDIKGFLKIENLMQISFYDGTAFRYTISEKDFLKKVSKFINVI